MILLAAMLQLTVPQGWTTAPCSTSPESLCASGPRAILSTRKLAMVLRLDEEFYEKFSAGLSKSMPDFRESSHQVFDVGEVHAIRIFGFEKGAQRTIYLLPMKRETAFLVFDSTGEIAAQVKEFDAIAQSVRGLAEPPPANAISPEQFFAIVAAVSLLAVAFLARRLRRKNKSRSRAR